MRKGELDFEGWIGICHTLGYSTPGLPGPPGTLLSNGVKVADKGEMWKIMKIAKNGLIMLLDIGLEVLCPDMARIY